MSIDEYVKENMRLRALWTAHYDEPELKAPDSFAELETLEPDSQTVVLYNPNDGTEPEWFQCDESLLEVPER